VATRGARASIGDGFLEFMTLGSGLTTAAGIDDTPPCRTVQQFYRGKFMKSKIRLD